MFADYGELGKTRKKFKITKKSKARRYKYVKELTPAERGMLIKITQKRKLYLPLSEEEKNLLYRLKVK